MKPARDIERLLDRWLDDGPSVAPDRVLDAVTDRIDRQRQRPAWRLLWRNPPMTATFKLATAAAAIVVAAVGISIVGRPSGSGIGGPATTPSDPTTSASSPSPSEIVYETNVMEVPVRFRLVDGFAVDFEIHDGIGLVHPSGLSAGFGSATSLRVAGPARGDSPQDWPADLASWLETQPYLTPEKAGLTTVGGRSAVVIDADVTPATGAPVKAILWDGGSWDQQSLPERWRFIEIKPSRSQALMGLTQHLIVVMAASPDKFDAAAASLDQLLATLEFVDLSSP